MKNKKYLLLLLIVPLLLGGMQLMKSEKSTITALYLEDQRLDTIGFHP